MLHCFWETRYFVWKIENFDELQLPKTLISFAESLHVSYLPMSTKGCMEYFLFCLELELFAKIKKDLVSTHSHKPGLSITQDLNKFKKIPHTLL